MILVSSALLWVLFFVKIIYAEDNIHEESAKEYLKALNEESLKLESKLVNAQWNLETNRSELNKEELVRYCSI